MKKALIIMAAAALLAASCAETPVAHFRADDIMSRQGDTVLYSMPVEYLAKGSDVDFFATVSADTAAASQWALEYNVGDGWKRRPGTIHAIPRRMGHNTVIAETFTTSRTIRNGTVEVRLVPASDGQGSLIPAGDRHIDQRLCTYQGIPVRKTINVALIGNSFTYYYGAGFMLKEIARCEGVMINLNASLKGGQYFRDHIGLELTREMVEEGGYDYVFFQDQSQQTARYYEGLESVLTETAELVDYVKNYSPDAFIILEATWAYEGDHNWQGYGCYEAFDNALQQGAESIAEQLGIACSPIGKAFALAREKGINLYWQDGKHQNVNGSYLKACVNYLLITGADFDANVPDCGIDPQTAEFLRETARKAVRMDQ